jgi:hypothetical protein
MDPQNRCISRGVPKLAGPYNNNIQIVQSPGFVAILGEMVHETRIVPLDGRPHLGPKLRQWRGDSRGHWDGNTLVVETEDIVEKATYGHEAGPLNALSQGHARVIERFTRTGQDSLHWEVTYEDPAMLTRPVTLLMPASLGKGDDAYVFEFACHEGNYAMRNFLSASRKMEKD